MNNLQAKDHDRDGGAVDWTFTEVVRNLDIGILILDPDEEAVLFHNPALVRILPALAPRPNYLDILALFPDIQTMDQGDSQPGTIHYNRQIIGYTAYPVADSKLCLFIRDITHKSRLESIAQAVNTMDNLGFIFSGIRHEIGNPLNSIKMTASVLRRNLEQFSTTTVAEYIDRIYHETLRMEYLLKSLRSFSMFDKVDSRAQSLSHFLSHFHSLIHRDLESQNIDLQLLPPAEDARVLMDPQALHHALLNLVSNAAEALVGQPTPRITISSRVNGSLAWITIEDNGCGMTEEQKSHLFQPFYTTKQEGNGLGLIITRKLIAKMNGSLEIDSEEGSGTRARIALSLATDTCVDRAMER
ncbi:MAG: hypothetical protein Tsb0017_26830 [Geothermobacteraceae bacterium]